MKKTFILLCCVVTFVTIACSEKEEDTWPKDVQSIDIVGIPNDTIRLDQYETYQLQINVSPSDGTIKYISSNQRIFTIDNNGLITAQAGGSGVLTIIGPNGDSWIKTYCQVDVKEYVKQIVLNADNKLQILSSGTRNVSSYFTVSPYTVTNKTLTYESSNPSIVAVDPATGVVTCVAKGYAEVVAKSVDGSNITSEPIQFYSSYTITAVPRTSPAWTATASSTEGNPSNSTYRPARAIDGTTQGGNFWHASWSSPVLPPLYFQIDMGSARTFNEVEIYRRPSYADTRDVELYIIPADVTTEAGLTWTDERYVLWGSITFGDDPVSVRSKIFRSFPSSSITARYLMLKLPNSNRNILAGDQSLSEIVPRVIQ
jgi:hypothetical protein